MIWLVLACLIPPVLLVLFSASLIPSPTPRDYATNVVTIVAVLTVLLLAAVCHVGAVVVAWANPKALTEKR